MINLSIGEIMELLDALEKLVKNPLHDILVLEELISSENLVESYMNSDTHKIREVIGKKDLFTDMSHVISFQI